MITEKHEQEITDYLIFHRLPLDILVEVKDHMISQIADIQIEENVGFDEAFLKTKKLWGSEFKMTRYSIFYKEQIPVIVKRIAKVKYRSIFKKSLIFGLASFTVNLLLIYFSTDQETYSDLFRLYNSLFVMIPFLLWLFNKNLRKYVKKDFKYQGKSFFTIYQQNLGLFVLTLNISFQLILREDKYVFRFFRTDDPVSVFSLLIALIIPYILHTTVIFVLINFFEHKKTMTKMNNFLTI
ncbi:hypothetical protein [Chryseobacterium sp. SL1]|uniref:hypothetical protein n=1 Tax=Chryseobacterium sp. SL1 TaxID=2995159 RepID=UPI00227653D9|nr:hypothetical protein [Chryseobacterium sp. SL1]MCY1663608.1 hypothetical protein [Chryseobacterium sp. SL1]